MTALTVTPGDVSKLYVPTEADIAAARVVSSRWGWLVAGGIVSMLIGIAVLSIRWDVDRLATFMGLVFAVRGITEIATSGSRPHRGAAVFSGVAGIIVAVIAFSWPGPTLFVIATLTGIWLAIWGLITIVATLFERVQLWGLWLIAGLAAVPLGGWALAHPEATLAVIVAVIGFWAILGGLMEVFAGFEVRGLPDALEARRAATTTTDPSPRSAPSAAPSPVPGSVPAT